MVDEPSLPPLRGRRILLVEDDYLLASELARSLEEQGITVVGPAASVDAAVALIAATEELDGAVLDINLSGEMVYPVADLLTSLGIPFVFATGYTREAIPSSYRDVPHCEKPIETAALASVLLRSRRR